MDVQLPDGSILKGVPDGTTKDQIAQKLQANGKTVPQEWFAPKTASSPKVEEPGIGSKLVSAAVRPIAKGVAALPLMAMDAGVATRNLVEGRDKSGQYPYELPSSMFNKALDSATFPPSGAGKVAEEVSSALVGAAAGPQVPKSAAATLKPEAQAARNAGYVLPPSQARPTLLNQLAEGFSGKIKTGQLASQKNQEVTNGLVRKALGLKPGAPITVDTLKQVRAQAGKAYAALDKAGDIDTDPDFHKAVASIGRRYATSMKAFGRGKDHPVSELVGRLSSVQTFSGEEASNEISLLREEAEKAAANRDKGTATAMRQAATAIEDQIDRHLSQSNPKLIDDFRHARQLIAKTYSVQSALDRGTGDVSAAKLSSQLGKDKPLSGELKKVAEVGTAFPKATQLPSKMGSVTHFSPLDTAVMGMEGASGLTAAIAAGDSKAAAAAAVAMAVQASRPAVRAGLLSKAGQKLTLEGAPAATQALKKATLAELPQREIGN